MKAYLVHQKRVEFQVDEDTGWDDEMSRYSSEVELDIVPSDVKPWHKNVETGLSKSLKQILKVEMAELDATFRRYDCTVEKKNPPDLYVSLDGGFLKQLPVHFGTGVQLKLELSNAQVFKLGARRRRKLMSNRSNESATSRNPTPKVTSKERTVSVTDDDISLITVMPKSWLSVWPNSKNMNVCMKNLLFSVKMSIIVSLSNVEAKRLLLPNEVTLKTRNLLKTEFETDMEIISSNGSSIKCHSLFLKFNSEVIKTMLESDLEESRTKKIIMNDMSEKGVMALLAFIYYRNLAIPDKNSVVAVELLKAADKYMIKDLEASVKVILLEKEDAKTWFDPEAVLTLYFFAGVVDRHKDLMAYSKRLIKSKKSEIRESALYTQLCEDDPNAAKHISQL